MTRTAIALLIALSLGGIVATASPAPAQGFTFSGIGGRIGPTWPEDSDDTALAAIFHLEFMKPGSRWHFSPEFRFWEEGLVTDLNPNLNAFYHFSETGRVSPYLGAGFGVHFYDFDVPGVDRETDLSGNLLGGILFPVGARAHLFAEARYAITDLAQFDVLGGFTIHLID